MTESPGTRDAQDPRDLGSLDRDSFVGDAPAGDATPGEVTSNHQAAQPSGAGNDADTPTEEDA